MTSRFGQRVLVEEFLPGREFTVGIVSTGEKARVLGVMEVLLKSHAEPEIYSYHNKGNYVSQVSYQLIDGTDARSIAEMAMRVWKGLGCRDAGRVDLRCAGDGTPNFLEANPLVGLHPIHSDLVIRTRLK